MGVVYILLCMGTHYVQYNSETSDIVCDCQKHCIYSMYMYVLPPSNGVHACCDTQ